MPVYDMPVYALRVGVIMQSDNDAVNDGEGDDGATIDLILANMEPTMSVSPTESCGLI